jgi:hypothetical protein
MKWLGNKDLVADKRQIKKLEDRIEELQAVVDRLADDEWFTEAEFLIGMSTPFSTSYETEIDARIKYAAKHKSKLENEK